MAWRHGAAPTAGAPVAALSRLREGCYRLFSQSLLYPQEERLRGLALAVNELARRGRRSHLASCYPGWREILRAVEALASEEIAPLQSQYIREFYSTCEGGCSLWESSYIGENASAQSHLLAQLAKEYAQAGVTPSPYGDESRDHAAVELEFMVYLCSMEAEAWEQEDLISALEALRQESGFLERHLTGYFIKVGRSVADCSSCDSYRCVIATAADFVLYDLDLLKALLRRFQSYTLPSDVP